MIRNLTPKQAFELISSGDVDVIDVRDQNEHPENGHLPGARFVPLPVLQRDAKSLLESSHNKGVVFVCAAGVRSQTASRIAAAQGLQTIYNVTGGTRAWLKAGLDLIDERSASPIDDAKSRESSTRISVVECASDYLHEEVA